ncbi:MAG: DNA repair protein RadA [Alphaproteobacteria bacterium]|nr:DNA repair protein RadA [Alphaproteobacteria bacterium]
MVKSTSSFICQECGAVHPKWMGKCEACGAWNTIVEEAAREAVPKGISAGKGKKLAFSSLSDAGEEAPRIPTLVAELDRVLGGGLVEGSAILIGGDPGIGKSTLLLQAVAATAKQGFGSAYISGEESVQQIRLRAKRLGLVDAPVQLAAANSVRDILGSLDNSPAPRVAVIDSVQTLYVDSIESAPGTVTQVRASASELIRMAKRRNTCLLLVGHVTKDGQIAGPRVLEHMVDTVLYFEGERGHPFRILRAVKNRFGGTEEIGVFEMGDQGLSEVSNPSALFMAQRGEQVSGSVVFAGMEGSRPMLVEIQALVAPSFMATPRRAVVGWDTNRLAMILAVLDARCGVRFHDKEVYLNVAGGFKIGEPAADLAVAAALLSALLNRPAPQDAVFFGEIGLSGEVRPVARTDARLKEAQKLGFSRAIHAASGKEKQPDGMKHLQDMVRLFRREQELVS